MGFPKQEDWSGLPFLSPGDLSNSGIKPALAGRFGRHQKARSEFYWNPEISRKLWLQRLQEGALCMASVWPVLTPDGCVAMGDTYSYVHL